MQIEFDAASGSGVSAHFFNAGFDTKVVQHKKKPLIESLRETGTLRFEIGGQVGEVGICYYARGQCKDVLRVTERHNLLPRVAGMVLKVCKVDNHSENETAANMWRDLRLEGVAPEVYALNSQVPVYHRSFNSCERKEDMSVLAETYCGRDIGVEFQELLDANNWEAAVRLWHGAVCFWLDWQLTPGRGRVIDTDNAMRIIKDLHCRNLCRWQGGSDGYAIVDTLQFVDVNDSGRSSSEAKKSVRTIIKAWIDMLDLLFQKVVTGSEARAYSIAEVECIKQTRNNSTILDEVKAYRGLSDRLAVMLCRGLGVRFLVSQMPDSQGTAKRVRKTTSLQVDRDWHEDEIDYGRASSACSSNRSHPYSGAVRADVSTVASGSQRYSGVAIHTGSNASYSGAFINTGRRSFVPDAPATSRSFADRNVLHTSQAEQESQHESEHGRILEEHLNHMYSHILSEWKSEESIKLDRNFTHTCDSQQYYFAMQYLNLLRSVIQEVYPAEMGHFVLAAQNRLNTCSELTAMRHFGKNGRGLFVVGLMEQHGIGRYPREGGVPARLQWLPQSAVVVITREVVAKLLLDPYTHPNFVSKLAIRKLHWFIQDVWKHYGQQTCEDLCVRLEERLVDRVTREFHTVLTIAKLAGHW